MQALAYFYEYKDIVFEVLAALHVAAVIVVNATPTPADNSALASLYSVVEKAAGVISPNVKM